MRYMVASMAVLSCVFFESECGFGRFLEKAGRDIGKASHNIAKASEREVKNFNNGTIKPAAKNMVKAYDNHVQPELKKAEKNISKNNDRLKGWFHREAQPVVKEWYHGKFLKEIERIKQSIQDLRNRVRSGETQEADEGIQTVREDIRKLSEGVKESIKKDERSIVAEEGPTRADIGGEIGIARKELEAAQTKLKMANKKLELAKAKSEKADGTELSEVDKYELEIDILDAEYEVQVKELEILRLEEALKEDAS